MDRERQTRKYRSKPHVWPVYLYPVWWIIQLNDHPEIPWPERVGHIVIVWWISSSCKNHFRSSHLENVKFKSTIVLLWDSSLDTHQLNLNNNKGNPHIIWSIIYKVNQTMMSTRSLNVNIYHWVWQKCYWPIPQSLNSMIRSCEISRTWKTGLDSMRSGKVVWCTTLHTNVLTYC